MDQADKKAKRKMLFWKISGLFIIVAISIASSSMNLAQVGKEFLLSFVQFGKSVGDNSSSEGSRIVVKGKNVRITNDDILRIRELQEVLAEDDSIEYAIDVLKEMKTLNYHGELAGFYVAESDLDQYRKDLITRLKKSDEFKYDFLLETWGSEKGYWDMMKWFVQERVMADHVLKEQRTKILERNADADIDQELAEYVKKLIEYEEFK